MAELIKLSISVLKHQRIQLNFDHNDIQNRNVFEKEVSNVHSLLNKRKLRCD